MESKNTFEKGIIAGVDSYRQPTNSLVDGMGGSVVGRDKNFIWSSAKGTEISFSIDGGENPNNRIIIDSYDFGEELILFLTDGAGDDEIGSVQFTPDGIGTYTPIYTGDLGLRLTNPVRSLGIIETERIKRIYWWDDLNQPRSLNIMLDPTLIQRMGTNYLNLSPTFDAHTLQLELIPGDLPFGGYFYGYRLITHNGLVSDWSIMERAPALYLSPPNITGGYNKYQAVSAGPYPEPSGKGIKITLNGVDPVGVKFVEFCSFVATAEESAPVGKIIFREPVVSSTVIVYHQGGSAIGNVTLDDINSSSITVLRNRVGEFSMNHFVIGDITERPELIDEAPSVAGATKFTNAYTELVCDTRGVPLSGVLGTDVGLFGHKLVEEGFDGILFVNQWYRLKGTITFGGTVTVVDKIEGPISGSSDDWFIAGLPTTGTLSNVNDFYNGKTVQLVKRRWAMAQGSYIGDPIYDPPVGFTILDYLGASNSFIVDGDLTLETTNDEDQVWYSFSIETTELVGSYSITKSVPSLFQSQVHAPYTLSGIDAAITPVLVIPKYSYPQPQPIDENGSPIGPLIDPKVYEIIDLNANDYLDYKNQVIANRFNGFKETDRVPVGVLPFDKYGKKMAVIPLGIMEFPSRGLEIDGTSLMHNMKNPGEAWAYQSNIRVMNMVINHLDITSIIDKVSAIAIVFGRIENDILSDGVLQPIWRTVEKADGSFNGDWENPEDNLMISLNFKKMVASGDPTHYPIRQKSMYSYLSPDHMFGLQNGNVQQGDILKLKHYLKPYPNGQSWVNEGNVIMHGGNGTTPVEFLIKAMEAETGPYAGRTAPIKWMSEIEPMEVIAGFQKEAPLKTLSNFGFRHLDAAGDYFRRSTYVGCKRSILELDFPEVTWSTDTIGTPFYKINTDETITVAYVQHIRPTVQRKVQQPFDEYTYSGWFLEITPALKASMAVMGTGQYILNDIHVWGGGTYVYPMDVKHSISDIAENADPENMGIGIIFPVQTRINLAARWGNHFAKNWKQLTYNSETGALNLDEFNTNGGYNSTNFGNKFMSIDYELLTDRQENIIRWSNPKILGEKFDSFLNFRPENFFGVIGNNGRMNHLRYENNRLFIFFERYVGYIPIQERSVVQSSSGQSLSIGESGSFERLDEVMREVGCSHKNGVIHIPSGIMWYDKNTDLFYKMQEGKFGVLSNLSMFVRKFGLSDFKNEDNTFLGAGIIGGSDTRVAMSYLSLKNLDDSFITIEFLASDDFVNTRLPFIPTTYLNSKSFLLTAKDQAIYVHGNGLRGVFYDELFESWLEFLVNDEGHIEKKMDNWQLLPNLPVVIPNRIKYESSNLSIEEVISALNQYMNRYAYTMGGRIHGSFPVGEDGERMLGDTFLIRITFNNSNNREGSVKEFKTMWRKI